MPEDLSCEENLEDLWLIPLESVPAFFKKIEKYTDNELIYEGDALVWRIENFLSKIFY